MKPCVYVQCNNKVALWRLTLVLYNCKLMWY